LAHPTPKQTTSYKAEFDISSKQVEKQKIHYEYGGALTERTSSGLASSASIPVVL
jgi:hypothetical protein